METIPKIRAYVNEAQEMQDSAMDLDASATEARLEKTVRDLQARVEQQQAELEMLRSQSNIDIQSAALASGDPRQKLQQLLAVKAAYQSLKPTATYLPPPGSILPSLLAARTIQQNITASKSAITLSSQENALSSQHLRREEANLHDARLLTRALEARITQLRTQQHARSQKTPAQLARDLIAAKRAQKAQYDAATQRLGDAMNVFINDYLSSMLAAEELGGPVVGDMLQVEDDTLAAGFTKKGKAKSAKKPLSEKTRQKRIDQIWGSSSRDAANVEVGDAAGEEEQLTEAEAADAEMRALMGNLFATLMGGAAGGKAYLQLQRDSAAARFLVRAKIAQFHPRDAMKLRLIDFGRELDD